VGHLNSPVELSSSVLGSSLFNVTGLSIICGLASGLETICGQVGTHARCFSQRWHKHSGGIMPGGRLMQLHLLAVDHVLHSALQALAACWQPGGHTQQG
jgi:hypothetical protein